MASRRLISAVLLLSLVGCGLCWRQGPGMYENWPPMPVPGMDVDENPILCEACTIIVEELQSVLGNDSKKIIAVLEEICNELPTEYAATCNEYVKEWTPIIIDFIENETPKEICQDLTLCTAAQPAVLETPPRLGYGHLLRFFKKTIKTNINKLMIRNALGNQFLCDGCNEIVSLLGQELTNPQTLNEIVTLLSEGCALCPVPDKCRAAIQKIPAEVTAFVDKYLNNQTCKALGLCSTAMASPMDMFSRFFSDVFPDNLDMDMLGPGRPKPNSRPRPDTEPAPRPHPMRGNFKPFFGPSRPDHENRNHSRHEGREHDEHENRNNSRQESHENHDHHSWDNHSPDRSGGHDRPHRHHHDFRPDHPRPHHDSDHPRPHHDSRPEKPHHDSRSEEHDRPHNRPSPGGRSHQGPIHGFLPEDDIPLPDVRPWWRPAMKPFKPRPSGGKPALPEEPTVPHVDTPEIPYVHMPEVEIPEIPTLDIEPVVRNPFHQDGRPRTQWTPNVGKGGVPAKPWRRDQGKGHRRQRSVLINTVIGTENFDETTVDKPVEGQVESSWMCDMCEYDMEVLQSYLTTHKDVIEGKLLSIADRFCAALPSTSTDECMTEMADLLPTFVEMVIEYLSADNFCPILKLC